MTDNKILAELGETTGDSALILGLNVYGNVEGNVQTVLSYSGTSQVPAGLAWVTGDFTGSGSTQIAEPWAHVLD